MLGEERSRHLLEERLFFGVEKGHFDPSSFGPAPLRTRQFQYPFCNDVELHLASAALDRKALAAQPQQRIGHAAPPRRVPRQPSSSEERRVGKGGVSTSRSRCS